MKLNKKSIFIILGIILIGVIIYNSLSQPGIKNLSTNFKEISFVRNEQNAGPVLRAYIVIVDKTDKGEMLIYGNFMPHTKYGNTKVYFFANDKSYPSTLSLESPFFDERFKDNCIAIYEKNGMGDVVLMDF